MQKDTDCKIAILLSHYTIYSILIYDVTDPDEITLTKTLPVKNALEIDFSPCGSFLSSWIRPIKLEDGAQHKNLQIWSTKRHSTAGTTSIQSNGHGESEPSEEDRELPLAAFTQKAQEAWKLQFTEDESYALRSIQNEIHLLDPSKNFTLSDKIKVENIANFSLSPGKNPSVAIFVPEKKV